jgi:flagellar FliL protein
MSLCFQSDEAGTLFVYVITTSSEEDLMAEEKEEAQAEDEKPIKAKKSNKSLFILIGIIVVALAGGIGVYSLLFSGKESKTSEAKHEKKEESKTALIALDSFVLNLAEQGRFLKVTMQFELADIANQPLVTEKTPQLRDAIITLVSSKSAEGLTSPEGKMQIKDELLLRANQAVGKDVFKNLYFTEFVMQ